MTSALMLQGTGSDVGKSLLVAGLCRHFSNQGLRVRPFKPQNMSNNAAVAADGGEIGRAQALQAWACGLAPSHHMNPVLLKPQGDRTSQLIVRGKMRGSVDAREYWQSKATLLPEVLESYHALSADADLILVEGAGSPAEINLRRGDIANMGFAVATGLPVLLVADIERGGVIASVCGTFSILEESERDLIKGFIINKFRGDIRLFDEGVAAIDSRIHRPSLGVLPYWQQAGLLPAEDSMALSARRTREAGSASTGATEITDKVIKIAVLRLPLISNFDDFDPLIAEPKVDLSFVKSGQALPGDCDLVILPGSKSTRSDLDALRREGWDIDIAAHVRRGGRLLGICGGLQMLGNRLVDPDGIEGTPGESQGLALLPLETVLTGDKRLVEMTGRSQEGGHAVWGYEMHVGRTTGAALDRPMLQLEDGPDGVISPDGRIQGCYLHGLFASDTYRHAFLRSLRPSFAGELAYDKSVEETLDLWAEHLATYLDLDRIAKIAGFR